MGKGDTRRLSSIPKEQYDANFEAIFGKREPPVWEDAPRLDGTDGQPGGEVPENGHEGRDIHVTSEHSKEEDQE